MDYGTWNSGDWVCFHLAWQTASRSRLFFAWYFSWSLLPLFWETWDDHSHLDGFSTPQPHELFSQPLVPCGRLFLFCHWSQDVNGHLCGDKSHLFLWLCGPDLVFWSVCSDWVFPPGFHGIRLGMWPIVYTRYVSVSLWADGGNSLYCGPYKHRDPYNCHLSPALLFSKNQSLLLWPPSCSLPGMCRHTGQWSFTFHLGWSSRSTQ